MNPPKKIRLPQKESPRLPGQNRRMFRSHENDPPDPHWERVQLTLMVALLAACAANVALVWAWL